MLPGDPGMQHEQDPLQRLADPAAACGPDSGSAARPLGSSGSTRSHNSSDTIHGATAIGTPPSLTTDADGFVVRERVPSFRFDFLVPSR